MERTLILLLVLFGGALPVHADQLGIVLNGRSIHLGTKESLNEANLGAGLEYHYTTDNNWVPFLTVSGFRDSNENMSYYAGGGIKHRFQLGSKPNQFYVDTGAVVFLMTREDYRSNRPFPGILPVVSLGIRNFALNIAYVPDIREPMQELVFFQLVYFLDEDLLWGK